MDNNHQSRILLIDDEKAISETVVAYGLKEKMQIDWADSGEEGLKLSQQNNYDLILLDWMLPGLSGLDLIKIIREKSNIPILMLSARNDEMDIVLGLEMGADDYITKPFGPRELIARIHSLLRRNKNNGNPNNNQNDLVIGNLTISFSKKEITKDKKIIEFTSAEFHILEQLNANLGNVVSRETLMTEALGYRDFLNDRTLDTHIKNIRKKIEDDPQNPEIIKTVRESGFKLIIPNNHETTS